MTLIAAAVYSYNQLASANELLTAQLDVAKSQVATREAESARLAQDIESIEAINHELMRERNRMAEIESRYQVTTEQLTHELQTAQQAINELRQSDHEDVKSWANTRVPDSALRLLGNTGAESSDQDRDDNHASIPVTAREPFNSVRRSQL